MNWLSLHLFYEDLDILLKEAVFPMIDKIQPEQYFYIRYGKGGKHVRLRIQSDDISKLEAHLITYFKNYFKQNPSNRREEQLDFYPNHSIQNIVYEPEYKRYGGENGIKIAHQQFQLSANVVKSVMMEDDAWSYADALSTALQMQMIMVNALGFSKKETVAFFENYKNRWQPEGRAIKIDKHFDKNILASVYFLWEQLEENPDFEYQELNDWYNGHQKILLEIQSLTADFSYFEVENLKRQKLFALTDSFIHMNNNRLGVYNADEALLAAYIASALEQ